MPRNPAGTEIARHLCEELSSRLTTVGGKPVTPRQLERLGSTGYACTPHITRTTEVTPALFDHLLIALHLYRDHPRMDDRLVNISALILGSTIVSQEAIKVDVLSRFDEMIEIGRNEIRSENGFENTIDIQYQRTYRGRLVTNPSPQPDFKLAFHATRDAGLDKRETDPDDLRKQFQRSEIAWSSIDGDMMARYADDDFIRLDPVCHAQFMTAVDGWEHDSADYVKPFPTFRTVRMWIEDNGIPKELLKLIRYHYYCNIDGFRSHGVGLTTKSIEMCVMRAIDGAISDTIRTGL